MGVFCHDESKDTIAFVLSQKVAEILQFKGLKMPLLPRILAGDLVIQGICAFWQKNSGKSAFYRLQVIIVSNTRNLTPEILKSCKVPLHQFEAGCTCLSDS